LDRLQGQKQEKTYAKGASIFCQGAKPTHVHCLRTGTAKITQRGRVGREVIIRLAPEGDLVGHRSLFEASRYRGGATAVEPVTACAIPRESIMELIEREPAFSLRLLKKITKDMAQAEDRIFSSALRTARQRVAEVLVALVESHGVSQTDGSWCIDLSLTRLELSSLTGIATETLIRFLSELKEERLIESRGRSVVIADFEKLRAFSRI
jgi:CRP/FNR family transcriptional regulator, polysaccharide utilization system transcription regulator